MTTPKKTVLVVDDDHDLCEAIAYDFRRKGYEVLKAHSGNEAYRVIGEKPVDLVISDIRMPDGDGVSLLDRLRAGGRNVPVLIFVSGFADITTEDAYAKGANAVFSKPYDRQALFAAVARLLVAPEARWAAPAHAVNGPAGGNVAGAARLGRGGIFVEGSTAPVADQSTRFEVTFESGPISSLRGRGWVRWRRSGGEPGQAPPGVGLEFETVDPDGLKAVLEAIDALKSPAYIPKE